MLSASFYDWCVLKKAGHELNLGTLNPVINTLGLGEFAKIL